MQRHVMTTIVMVLATVGFSLAGDAPDSDRDARVEYAAQVLREAVDLVESTHSPDTNIIIEDAWVPFFDHRRPRIGVVVRSSGSDDEPVGAVIEAVTPGGPADKAGLEPGDVITHVDGRPLVTDDEAPTRALAARELMAWSRGLEDGQTVTIGYVRDGNPASVTLEARVMESTPRALFWDQEHDGWPPGGDLPRFAHEPVHWVFPGAWLDMELVALNPELGEYFNSDHGVLVVRAPDDDSLGLEAGDVILAIDGREVREPSHAMRILRSYKPDEELTLDIVRHGRSQSAAGTFPEASVELFSRFPRFHGEDD
jgi:S1-C subfamily serine protease